MSQNREGNRPDPQIDDNAPAAVAQPNTGDSDDDDDRLLGNTWDSGDLVHPVRGLQIRSGFMDGDQVGPGQVPQIPESRVMLQNSPTTRRRNSIRSPSQRLAPYRAAQSLSPARHGSPTMVRRNRATQTPPMERKKGPSKKPEDPKES